MSKDLINFNVLLDVFSPEKKSVFSRIFGSKVPHPEKLNNEILKRIVCKYFEQVLEEQSMLKDKRAIYHMNFNIFLHPVDFDATKETMILVVGSALKSIYETIRRYRDDKFEVTPLAVWWRFHFIKTEGGFAEVNGVKYAVAQGLPAIQSQVFSPLNQNNEPVAEDDGEGTKIPANTVAGLLNNFNVGLNLNIEMKDVGLFIAPFDRNLGETPKSGQPRTSTSAPVPAGADGYATISYVREGKKYTYTIKDSEITVSGPSEDRAGRNIIKLPIGGVAKSHLQIRRLPDGKFEVASFAKTRLNGTLMSESNGGNVAWSLLPNNSTLFLSDEVELKFKINN